MKLHAFLHTVTECESNVAQSTMVCNLAGITLQEIAVLWILHSVKLYVSLYVVHGDEFLDTQSTDI